MNESTRKKFDLDLLHIEFDGRPKARRRWIKELRRDMDRAQRALDELRNFVNEQRTKNNGELK